MSNPDLRRREIAAGAPESNVGPGYSHRLVGQSVEVTPIAVAHQVTVVVIVTADAD